MALFIVQERQSLMKFKSNQSQKLQHKPILIQNESHSAQLEASAIKLFRVVTNSRVFSKLERLTVQPIFN